MRKLSFHIFFLSLALAACDGGGDTPQTPPTEPGLQTSVPEPNYDDPGRAATFRQINDIRGELGMGLLAQSVLLDQAAQNHTFNAWAINVGVDRIYEDINRSGSSDHFTGATPQDRCAYVGYQGVCPDEGFWGGYPFSFDYHLGLLVLTQGAREVGVSRGWEILLITFKPFIQLGYPAGKSPQRQDDGFLIATYLWGVFHVQVNEGETLKVDAFQVWDSSGKEVTGQVLTSGTDPFHRVPSNAALLVPEISRDKRCGNTFSLYFAGERNGQPFTVTKLLTPAPPYCEVSWH